MRSKFFAGTNLQQATRADWGGCEGRGGAIDDKSSDTQIITASLKISVTIMPGKKRPLNQALSSAFIK